MSYIIVNKSTGIGVLEFTNPALRYKVNQEKYKVETVAAYLARVNREISAADANGTRSPYHTKEINQ